MKKLLLATAVAVFGLSSCGDQMGKVTSLKTMADSVSYAYGSYIGSSVKDQMGTDNEDFDINVFASAIKSAVKGDSTLLAPDEIQTILQNYFQNVKPAKDKAKDQAFLDDVTAKNTKAVKSATGLVYEIVELGDTTNKAMLRDTVSVLYTGKYSNGDVFDSTSKRGDQPTDLVLGSLVQGFNEGMQLIGKGGKINLWIPAELGYGDKLLVFEAEIVNVKKAVETPAAATTPAIPVKK